MTKSMTSFGRASNEEGNRYLFSVEMKSVNSRYLDVNIRMPKSIISLEEEVRKLVSEKLIRGKVDIFINQKSYSSGNGVAKLNVKLAESYLGCLKELEGVMQIKNDVSIMQIARLPEVITIVEEEETIEEIWETIKPLIAESLDNMISMRTVEGNKLKLDILDKLNEVESLVKSIEGISEIVPKAYRKKLELRLTEILQGVDIDESRVALEVAILADKASVDEEVIRLHSHINQMRRTFEEKCSVGRKLDFIIQEMNREANTIASKSNDMDMTNYVINIKNLIEKIREQTQNIE